MKRLALVAALLLGGCTFLGRVFEKPRVSFARVAVDELSFAGMTARFIFTIENPNTVGVDLAKLEYALVLEGKPFAQGATDAALHVPPSKSGELTVPLTLSFGQLVDGVQAIFKHTSIAYAMKTQLTFETSAGPMTIPVEATGTLPVPRLPRFSLAGVELASLTPTSATLEVTLAIANPNELEIPLGGLTWSVAIEGTPVAQGRLGKMTLAANKQSTTRLEVAVDVVSVGLAVGAALASHSAHITLDGSVELVPGQAWPLHLETTLRQ